MRKKGGSYAVVYVSEDNEDLLEVMDINEDGTVEVWEMKEFYNGYDLNGNGVLEDREIEATID